MNILFLLIGLLSGLIISWLYSNHKFNKAKLQLDKNILAEKELRIKAEANIESLTKVYNNAQENLKNSFDKIVNDAVNNNNENFLLLANQSMEKYFTPLKEKLDKHENLVKNIQSDSDKTFGSLRNYIEELNKSQDRLAKETNSLVSALKSPKVRGKWGEIGLKRIVEFSGMSPYCDFSEQVSVKSDEQMFRPDLIVYLPGNKQIVVDSKVPLNAYLDAIETNNEKLRKQFLIKHSKALQTHAKQLSSKAYWSQFDEAVDFVVLYIEVEPAFGAALLENNKLVLEAIKNRIVFATPTTLITLLQTVAYSWKQQKATENATRIWHSTKELYERIAKFTEHIQKIGTNIDSLAKSYNNAIGSWKYRVEPGLKKLQELGIDSEKKKIKELEKTDIRLKERQ